ncbi:hypothetical protein DQ04_10691020, partial [Trypanosoma grayi]|uniref:hypothetical protein n=1 Tax=Trypanosoma grayi TaxID=71804 RepID=UPI0004F4423D
MHNDMKHTLLCTVLLLLAGLAGAQEQSDKLWHSTVTLSLAGRWTAASVTNASFGAAVAVDVSVALGPLRAAAWPAAAAAVTLDPGPVTLTLEGWADPGTYIDRALRKAEWARTRAYFATVDASEPASPFVTSAVRGEGVRVRFAGAGWGDTAAMPDAELTQRITNAVAAVTDPTGTPVNLTGGLASSIDRTGGVVFNLTVNASGIQNVTLLLSSPASYEALLTYYATATSLTDGNLTEVRRTPALPNVQQYRTQVQVVFSGSWQLVLLSNKTDVLLMLQDVLAEALELDRSRVAVGNVSTAAYPFNLIATLYVVHLAGFDTSSIQPAIAAA